MRVNSVVTILLLVLTTSCNKSSASLPVISPRKIQYELYTNSDFSDNNTNIRFSLFIRTKTKVLLDSDLAPMKIKDIPDASNKIIIIKTVPNNDTSELSVGFLYSIEGIGNSWHLDTIRAGEIFKLVDYAFQ
jgi:hypothetical protein